MSEEAQTERKPPWRPTLYREEFCDRVRELGALGKSRIQIAGELGVVMATLQNWEAVHPDFLAATTHARELAQKWWEDMGQTGLTTPGFNAPLWSKQVSCRFRPDYTDSSKTELSGPGGEPLFKELYIVAVEPDK